MPWNRFNPHPNLEQGFAWKVWLGSTQRRPSNCFGNIWAHVQPRPRCEPVVWFWQKQWDPRNCKSYFLLKIFIIILGLNCQFVDWWRNSSSKSHHATSNIWFSSTFQKREFNARIERFDWRWIHPYSSSQIVQNVQGRHQKCVSKTHTLWHGLM